MNIYLMVLCWLAVDVAVADAYTAAVWTGDYGNIGRSEALSAVHAASASSSGEKADIMVLPSEETDSENYDEVMRVLSGAARQAGIYLVAPLSLRARPPRGARGPIAVERTTLVFGRQGTILAVSKKPACNVVNNTALPASPPSPVSFHTDFGVTFSLLAEEDLVLGAPAPALAPAFGHVRNVVLAGACHSEIPYFNAAQFAASWAYAHRVNVLTARGVVAGRAGPRAPEMRGHLALAPLDDNCDESTESPPVTSPTSLPPPRAELALYVVRQADLVAAAGADGYRDTVCHNAYCCEFYLKIQPTTTGPLNDVVRYGLAAFDGTRRFEGSKYIGVQNCAVFACAELYKRACSFGSVNNSTNITFEKLSISANLSNENTILYPVIFSDHHILPKHFEYVTKSVSHVKSVKMTVTDADNLLAFGTFGRVFERDYERFSESEDIVDFYKYIFNDDVHEFFDYLWIRIRILIVIVSIYVLEMM